MKLRGCELIETRIKLLQYVEAHQSDIKTSGTRLELGNPALLNELKPLLDEANFKAKAWEKIRNEVKANLRGR